MHWLIWLLISLALARYGRQLHTRDEVYGMALFSIAACSGLWGLVMAPVAVPLALAIGVMGWLQVRSTLM